MAHWIAGVFILIVVCGGVIFSCGWVAHEKFSYSYHAHRRMALDLPSIQSPRAAEPMAPAAAVGAPPTVVHVHLHQEPNDLWSHSANAWSRPARRGDVIDAQIVELPAAQGFSS